MSSLGHCLLPVTRIFQESGAALSFPLNLVRETLIELASVADLSRPRSKSTTHLSKFQSKLVDLKDKLIIW